jgi:Trk-type K+ transport system membrane component
MTSVIILAVIVVVALLVVRAGTVALELTGMERDKAWFQALSAFTTTGFTSRESEEIMRYPARRKIITVLIVVGYAGSVSVIATLVSTFIQREPPNTALHLSLMGVVL